MTELGNELSAKRQAAAKKLSPLVEKALAELGMEKAKFSISVSHRTGEASRRLAGFDALEFLVQTNPGQPPQPLRKIASGGELSRIMLALEGDPRVSRIACRCWCLTRSTRTWAGGWGR